MTAGVSRRLDPEQHGGPEEKRGNAAKAEIHGWVEGLDDQEGDPRKHQGQARVLYNFVHDGWARAAFSTSTMDGSSPGS